MIEKNCWHKDYDFRNFHTQMCHAQLDDLIDISGVYDAKKTSVLYFFGIGVRQRL